MLYDVLTIHPNSSGACEAIRFELVRQQLEQRVEQLVAAQAALEDRTRSLERNGPALPRPLRQQIAYFAAQLDEVRDELASLGGDRRSGGRPDAP